MMYVRGQPADFDSIAELSSDHWNWEHISRAYEELESHELGRGESRGANGPLKITMPTVRDELSERQIAAGEALGWPRKQDVNQPDDGDGIGYAPRTIAQGKRQSAAVAFLRPAEKRSNLTVLTECTVDRVTFDGKHATGVEILRDGQHERVPARLEVIVCGGAMASPGILERSGIGDTQRLKSLGIAVVHHSPEIGEGLIEHRGLIMQWKLKRDLSHNKFFHGPRLIASTLRYYLTRGGPMSAAAYEIGGWFRTRPGLNRPDAQVLIAPFTYDFDKQRMDVERHSGMGVVVYSLRPTSRGSIHISTRDPDAAASFIPNYRANEEDRRSMIGAVRMVRKWAEQEPLRELVAEETMPGPAYQTDEEILEAYDRFGNGAYHAVGSCRMGKDLNSVVDPDLRVRGVTGLRVMDTSIMPVIPAGNTQAPTMAMAWRAADIIWADLPQTAAVSQIY